MNYITLNNGVKIPQIGLGVFRTPDGADTANAVKWAIEAGYRHIDTAKVYGNEKSVGEGIRMSGIDRRDIFVTTKLWNEDIRQGRTKEAFLQSLEDMGLDYIDLYLIHWPANGYEKAWADMEDLYKAGKIKAIGVSNFNVHHLETLSENWTVVPAVNQIEIHPYYANIENVEYAKKNGIAIEAYGNEKSVGEGIRMSGIDRRDIFVTTKLWNEDIRQGRTKEAFLQSLEDMGLDYIDLYLIHWPANGYEKAWADMEDLYKAGKIKAIGVSNFNVHHLETLSENWTVVPAVNQIEIHPYYANIENVEYAKKNGIAIEAYSPLGGNGAGTLENEVIIALADKYGKTPAQIVLRWELQRGIIVLPKSTHQERIISNFDVFEFELSEDDMNAINELNKNEKHGSDPETFNF
uniref:aldo/keto reductase n=1 Tax=Lachnospira eligens TaxID=39485 RepID=UPI0040297413